MTDPFENHHSEQCRLREGNQQEQQAALPGRLDQHCYQIHLTARREFFAPPDANFTQSVS